MDENESKQNEPNIIRGRVVDPNGNYVVSGKSSTHDIPDTPIQLNGHATSALTILGAKKINVSLPGHHPDIIQIRGHVYEIVKNIKKPLANIQVFIEAEGKSHFIKKTGIDGAFATKDLAKEIKELRKDDKNKKIIYTLVFRDIKKRYSFNSRTVEIPKHGSPDPLVVTPRAQGNSISGFTIGRGGGKKLLSGIIVQIAGRDNGIPGRIDDTLTSNKMGFFSTTMLNRPLPSGHYTITATDPQGQYIFSPQTVNVAGHPIHIVLFGIFQHEEKREEKEQGEESDEEEDNDEDDDQDDNRKKRKKIENEEEESDENEEWQEAEEEPQDEDIQDTEGETPEEPVENAAKPTESVRQEFPEQFGQGAAEGAGETGNGSGGVQEGIQKAFDNPLTNQITKHIPGLSQDSSDNSLDSAKSAQDNINKVKRAIKLAQKAAQLAQKLAPLLANPVTWIIIGILLLILIIIMIIIAIRNRDTAPPPPSNLTSQINSGARTIPGFTIQKAVDVTQAGNEFVDQQKVLTYTITATNSQGLDVTVTDTVDASLVKIIDIAPNPTTKTDNTISWRLKDLGNGPTYSLTLKVQPLKYDSVISNKATATARGTTGGNIANCLFYRGYNSPGSRYKSQKLLTYFQEAESLSGVPASLLAAIARVESAAADLTDQDVDSGQCLGGESPTGALGLMQIEPAGMTGNDPGAIRLGVEFLNKISDYKGKTYESLSRADYCNPRESIILASGFVIKKMQYLYRGDGQTWNPSWTTDRNAINTIASGYYGRPDYSGGNYGDDLWNSVSNCKASSAAASKGFLPPDQVAQAYNITLKNFTPDEENTVRQILSSYSSTNLLALAQNATIEKGLSNDRYASKGWLGYAEGCDSAGQNGRVVLFSITAPTLTHELAHIVQRCNSDTVTGYNTDFESAFGSEGPISAYPRGVGSGQGICPLITDSTKKQSAQMQEDFADAVYYYLIPTAVDSGIVCGAQGTGANPYSSGGYSLHKAFVQKLIGQNL